MNNLLAVLSPADNESEAEVASTRLKLIRDAIGGIRLATDGNELLENVFVKGYERIAGSVTRLQLEVIFITPVDKESNW